MTFRTIAATLAVATLLACGSSSSGGGGGGGGALTVTAGTASLRANGVATTSITVSGTITYPLVLKTDLGTWENGSEVVSLASGGASATATLKPCDSGASAACAGRATVTATDGALATGRTTVNFLPVEICSDGRDNDGNGLIDCADTAACPSGTACGAHGQLCTGGVCACPGGTQEICGDGKDNNCDGLIDCADPQCQPHGSVAGAKCDTGNLGVGGAHVYGACTAAGACTCSGSGKETSCGDGIDNNCNGLIDCDDPDCQPVGNGVGGACDTRGNTCSPPVSGHSACTRCAPGGDPNKYQPTETSCGDGVDNDCNGLIDCQDPNCAAQGFRCDPNGKVCTAAAVCQCPDTSGQETSCADNVDNDCDGFIDCKDLDCNGKSCGGNGKVCQTTSNGNGSCVCPSGTTEICGDGIDNNCDSLIDCADPTCRATSPSTLGKDCATAAFPLNAGAKCDFAGQCVCPGGQPHEASCGDGIDNDCNGYTDCKDLACNGLACGANGKVCLTTANGAGSCVCPDKNPASQGGTKEVCNDGVDNNCDGLVDCADPSCQVAGTACDAAHPSYQCKNIGTVATPSWVCQDSTIYNLTVTANPARIPADGAATSTITAVLKDTSKSPAVAIANQTIAFSTSPIGSVPTSAVTDTSGVATVVFRSTSLTAYGTATVTASYAGSATTTAVTTVALPQLGGIALASQRYQVMGVLGSGYQETNTLTFQLTDSSNQPYPAGLAVGFTHPQVAGSYIGTTAACSGSPVTCSASGVTDANGQVQVFLHSGTTANVVQVTATAQAGSLTPLSKTASNIAIIGAKPSGGQISLDCNPKNVPAFTNQDCLNSHYTGNDGVVTCTVSLKDRYGNALGVATTATFVAEAGTVGPPAQTPNYDPSKAPSQQSGLGITTDYLLVANSLLPADVTPFGVNPGDPGYEYRLVHGWDGCGLRTHNPRDGLVSIIAMVAGAEEGFIDGSNGCPLNGRYDAPGSLPGCAGEYFIDTAEPFVDYNDNGVWDAGEPFFDVNGNGTWDGPNGVHDDNTTIWAQTRILYTDFLAVVGSGGLDYASRFYMAGSPPSPTGSGDGWTVFATKTGPPAQPATSTTVPFYVTDKNFNLLSSKYTYAAAKSAGTFSVAFPQGGAPTSLDGLGMTFTQQYCNTQTPTDPPTQCSGQCQWPICYTVATVGNFSYGRADGLLTITGGSSADGSICGYVTGNIQITSTGGGSQSVSSTMQTCGVSR